MQNPTETSFPNLSSRCVVAATLPIRVAVTTRCMRDTLTTETMHQEAESLISIRRQVTSSVFQVHGSLSISIVSSENQSEESGNHRAALDSGVSFYPPHRVTELFDGSTHLKQPKRRRTNSGSFADSSRCDFIYIASCYSPL